MAKIAVIDDNRTICHALVELLRSDGHDAWCVWEPRIAIRKLTDHPPDLVIVDVMMPEVDGIELLKRIKQNDDLKMLKVVMFSAVTDPEVAAETLRLGAADYLVKGWPWDRLYEKISGHLRQ